MYTVHWGRGYLCAAVVMVYGLWRRVRLWRMGQPALRTDQIRPGGWAGYMLMPWARGATSPSLPGLMHSLIFYSFIRTFSLPRRWSHRL